MEFEAFRKIPRLSKEIVITEKIDGTNAQVVITPEYEMLVGSRNRYITPENDNFGFARWCYENKEELLKLGIGRHYGEWWGKGIQRGYGREDKVFSLFNTSKWDEYNTPACCSVVPILYKGMFDIGVIEEALSFLGSNGSLAQPGFMKPEGIVVYHTAASTYLKKYCENDDIPKGLQANEIN